MNIIEFLKKKITNKKITCVSFDIFDTLISRPLFEPKDLFCFLDMYYRKLIPRTNLNFAKSREVAEKHARDKIRNTGHEEITLDQIYEQLYEECNINRDILKKIQNRERELEVEFCGRRNFGYELYLLALDLNKTVILTSDMYLDEITIKKILEKNPSISLVLDIHRDGINENTRLVTEVNGKKTAQIMFFNGMSRFKNSGNIDYLYNPYLYENLAPHVTILVFHQTATHTS